MKNSKRMIKDRQNGILEYLKKNNSADVNHLAALFHVTPMTVRRDLDALESQGSVRRFFGGVEYLSGPEDTAAALPDTDSVSLRKSAIARAAAAMIEDGDTVFMNSSSTALLALEEMGNKSIFVITNNGRSLYARRGGNVELFLTGGTVYGQKQSLVGEFALKTLSQVTATKCIIGVSGISVTGGITSTVVQETTINHQMLARCSGDKIVVAEGFKIGLKHNFFSGNVSDITHLITDSTADPVQLEKLRQQNIKIILVDQSNTPPQAMGC